MRHLPLVEWRTRSGIPGQQAFLREGRKFKFNLHGEVKRPGFGGNNLPQVDAVGKNLKEGMVCDGIGESYR